MFYYMLQHMSYTYIHSPLRRCVKVFEAVQQPRRAAESTAAAQHGGSRIHRDVGHRPFARAAQALGTKPGEPDCVHANSTPLVTCLCSPAPLSDGCIRALGTGPAGRAACAPHPCRVENEGRSRRLGSR